MLHFISSFLTKKVESDYNAISESFSETRQQPWKGWKHIEKYFDSKKSLLDVGCGNGRVVTSFPFKNYVGIDLSENLVKIAQKQHTSVKNASFLKGSFTELTHLLPNQRFDVILSVAVFHHLPSPTLRRKALKEVHKVLDKNGVFIFSIWNLLYCQKYATSRRSALLRSLLTLGLFHPRDLMIPWRKGSNKRKRYYYAFTENEVQKLLTSSGFEITETIPSAHGKVVAMKDAMNIYFVCKKKNS